MVITAEDFGSWHPTHQCVCIPHLTGEGERGVDGAWSLVTTVKTSTSTSPSPYRHGIMRARLMLGAGGREGMHICWNQLNFKISIYMPPTQDPCCEIQMKKDEKKKKAGMQAGLTIPCFFLPSTDTSLLRVRQENRKLTQIHKTSRPPILAIFDISIIFT